MDGLVRFNDSDSLNFQHLRSATEYPGETAEELDQPTGRFEDSATWVQYEHDSREWYWEVIYRDRGRNFRADMGFMPQVDTELWLGGIRRVWWGEEDDWYTSLELGGDWDYTVDQDGELLENEGQLFFEAGGPRQSYLFATVGTRKQRFDGVEFDQTFGEVFFEMDPSRDVSFDIWASFGDAIDFENTRPADRLLLEPYVRWNVGPKIRLELNHTYQTLDVEGGRLSEANLSQFRAVYQFSVRSFLRLITQYTRVERTPELFEDEVEAREERLFNQLLFSYKLNPQTVFFLGYSETGLSDDEVGLTRDNRTLFLKIGYAWVP